MTPILEISTTWQLVNTINCFHDRWQWWHINCNIIQYFKAAGQIKTPRTPLQLIHRNPSLIRFMWRYMHRLAVSSLATRSPLTFPPSLHGSWPASVVTPLGTAKEKEEKRKTEKGEKIDAGRRWLVYEGGRKGISASYKLITWRKISAGGQYTRLQAHGSGNYVQHHSLFSETLSPVSY